MSEDKNNLKQYNSRKELLKEYCYKIKRFNSFEFHFDNVPEKLLKNAKKKFAPDLVFEEVIGFYDTSLISNGKSGTIFTEEKIYYQDIMSKPKKLWYDDIKEIKTDARFNSDEKYVYVETIDGDTISFSGVEYNPISFIEFLYKMRDFDVDESSVGEISSPEFEAYSDSIAVATGNAVANYGEVNKAFEEEKFHARQGHGFAAEKANNLYDNLTGHDAKIVGDDNAKNGADRIVDGINIQSKYCATGRKCVNECFENDGKGAFRYLDNGKPMQIEVPSDKYTEAVATMEEKISNGQVEGVTDPSEAKNIIRKGHFTYQQVKNIAKAGTIESITYDAVNGAIIALPACGVTAIITFATNCWNGESFENSVKTAAISGLKVFGTAFATTVIAGQLSRAGLNSALVGSSEAIIAVLGPKASAVLINAFRSGSNIYGAAAMKSAAKLLRGNAITAAVTFAILSTADVANIFRGRISGAQLFKNLTNTAASVGAGTAGWMAGAAMGSVVPGVGTVVGGLVGSLAAGAVANKATNAVLDQFIEDDADKMVRIIQDVFQTIAEEYLLNKKEGEKSVDRLGERLTGKLLKDMYASSDRKAFARNLIEPIVEREVTKRKKINLTNEQIAYGLKLVLEEESDDRGKESISKDSVVAELDVNANETTDTSSS